MLGTSLPGSRRSGSRLVLVLVEDRTRERRVEAIRRDFVANVSHELKTPVGALNLLAEAVAEAADDPEAVQRFSARMRTESERLTRLVQQIIELSRLQGDDPLDEVDPVSVDAIAERAIDRVGVDAADKGIELTFAGEHGFQVLGNGEQLVVALGNLVENAVAYSPDGTEVTVSAPATNESMVDLVVTDQGVGIPADELDRIFERFYRVDPARARSTGGTGLGLSIVKHVAATHGGEVRVWSVEGEGSTFTLIACPGRRRTGSRSTARSGSPREADGHAAYGLSDDPLIAQPRRTSAIRGGLVTRVLVVEDEESYSDAAGVHAAQGRLRRRAGRHRPGRARGVRAQRCRHRAARPDAARPSRHRGVPADPPDRRRVPVIMVSAKDAEVDKVVGLELGADDYVTKPYSPRELVARIRAVLRRGVEPDLAPATLEAGAVRMDVERHVVTVKGEEVRLPLKEFELLEMFLRNAGRVLTRGQLIDRVWGADYVGDTKTLDVHVKRLRAKIEPDPANPRHLVTVRGLGYKYDAPVPV